jgi:hypothetical protein
MVLPGGRSEEEVNDATVGIQPEDGVRLPVTVGFLILMVRLELTLQPNAFLQVRVTLNSPKPVY